MTEDTRRIEAICNFYQVYRELQWYENLRMHTHTSIYERDDTLIEIYRYYGERKGERILRVTQEDEVEAYEQARDQVESLLQSIKQDRETGRRGA